MSGIARAGVIFKNGKKYSKETEQSIDGPPARRVTERFERGTVFILCHFKDAAANLLTNDALDPEAKIPEYKVAAVRISKENLGR